MTLHCATEREQFLFSGQTAEANNQSGTYGVRQSFSSYGSSGGDFFQPRLFGTWPTVLWCGWRNADKNTVATGYVVEQWNALNGDPIMRWVSFNAVDLSMQWHNGSTWITFANASVGGDYLGRWDVKIELGATGEIKVYKEGAFFGQTGIIDLSHVADCSRWFFEGNAGNNSFDTQRSEFIWGDEITIGARVIVGVPTGDGFHTDGSATFASVDEENPDGATLDLAANGDRHSFTHNVLNSPPADWEVVTVQLNTYLRKSGAGIENARQFLRVGGTDYDKGVDISGVDVGFIHFRDNWDDDPSTAAAWLLTDALSTSAEFGILAQT